MNYSLKIEPQLLLDTLKVYEQEVILKLKEEVLTPEMIEEKIELLRSDAIILISENISPNPVDLIDFLSYEGGWTGSDFIHSWINKKDKLKYETERLQGFQKTLNKTIKYLALIVFGKLEKPVSTLEKTDFLLNKLNHLFGDDFYSASIIFNLNGIPLRENEAYEITEDLKRREYIIRKSEYTNSVEVKISIKGSAYIERKNKTKTKKIKDDSINKKLDYIIERLEILGFGDEIIFNEIEELRELQLKLSKKSWSQLLKGKLIDLALDKLINAETVSYIYKYLTDSDLKLLP